MTDKNKYDTHISSFIYLFNQKESLSTLRKDSQEKFNVISGKSIITYASNSDSYTARSKIIESLGKKTVSKKFKIIEPAVVYHYNLLSDIICAELDSNYYCTNIKELKLNNRQGNISEYLIDAEVYPEILEKLYAKFSLNNLYDAYIRGDELAKKTIKNFINLLDFKEETKSDYNDFISTSNFLNDTFNLNIKVHENIENLLNEASLNNTIINNFNLEEKVFNIKIGQNEYSKENIDPKNKLLKLTKF